MNGQTDIYTNLLLKLSKKALALGELPISAIIIDPVNKKVIFPKTPKPQIYELVINLYINIINSNISSRSF
jgi:hypothetical protein